MRKRRQCLSSVSGERRTRRVGSRIVRGSNGYLVEEHPLLIIIGVLLLLVVLWMILRRR